MKRNWDVIREVLIRFEEKPSKERALQLDAWSEDIQPEVSYNVDILLDGGLLDGKMLPTLDPGPINFLVFRLTWQGHEFLDAIKNDTVWNKTKESFVSKGLSMTFELVKSVAISITKELLM